MDDRKTAEPRSGPAGAASGVETEVEGVEERPPLPARILRELRTHPFGYSVLAIFLVIGPIGVTFLFPQAPPAVAVVGGLAFGAYAALCAVPQKFL